MHRTTLLRTAAAFIAAVGLRGTAAALGPDDTPAPVAPRHFHVSYDASVTDSFTGRVYLMFGRASGREPRFGPSWWNTQPFYAMDVTDWTPDRTLVFDDDALAYLSPLSQLEPGEYAVQAVMRRSLDSQWIGSGEGTAYSDPVAVTLTEQETAVDVHIDQLVGPQTFRETDRVKLAELRSELLSAFHGRDIIIRAAVVLPEGYDASGDSRYPAYYWIGGFGSSHYGAHGMKRVWDRSPLADRFVRIYLDAGCYGGHHVFADSTNNGPRGTALVEEFIPHLERTFRLVPSPSARFVSGHSSGGWASLWLQVAYPDAFGGVFSFAPDPIDFTDFQRINLYADGVNMYRDEQGERRPVARRGDTPMMWYDEFVAMETVYGEGGQIRSFEWVFSPRGPDGLPLEMFDRRTGTVHRAVAETWRKYDIRRVLEENWQTLGPKLAGKLHVFAGGTDTFYLEGPVEKLKAWLAAVESDAVIEVFPGADHGSFATPDLRERVDRLMWASFERAHPQEAARVLEANVLKQAG